MNESYLVPMVIMPQVNNPLDKLGVVRIPSDVYHPYPGNCVAWVQAMIGVGRSGNAITWQRYKNTDISEVGNIVVMKLSRWGHVGILKEVGTEENGHKGEKLIRSRNFRGLYIVSDDWISDSDIVAYIRP